MTTCDPSDIVISRPLSVSENFFRSRTASGNYRNFQVTATYQPGLKNNLKLFYQALRKLVLDYHILITNVQFNTTIDGYVYEPLKQVDFASIVGFVDNADYISNDIINENFMKYINQITFDLYSQTPLFKLILVGEDQLCAVFEHTIADGLVARYIHEILLENLAYCENGANWNTLQSEYGFTDSDGFNNTQLFNLERDQKFIKNSLPPPIDLFLPIDGDYTGGDPYFSELVAPPGTKGKWAGRFLAVDTHDIAFKLINFPDHETNQILKKCKTEKVSVTAYIEAILALTLYPVFSGKYASFKCAMALRRHMDATNAPKQYHSILSRPEYRILGTSAHMGFGMNLPPVKEFSWYLVRLINNHIVDGCNNKMALSQMKGFKDIANLKDATNELFFSRQLNKPKADAIKISNLGFALQTEHQSESGSTWMITNMIFSQDMAPYASEFMLNVISTAKGGLNLTLSYYDYTFEDSKCNNFDYLVANLKKNMIECLS
ncbi:Alcohol acetyltransferase family protein [Candida parapsilosis]|uniref:Alcohol acetyltransferase n=2 Tax=Candida parapsilosis TaxID=5480 RepID=G8BAJ0_CANPC|nr:uncharacterized protein CPAR2_806130 [Candida parapsilosis]KAF6051962.1 Alcohol acetyltransferase family protein [Candida parapsilosis]KAF6052541.1 Alcohol acetyltransferase family protein [Candida parapsilosis]KAF6053764.1 Alcohol acetyltransferase family protein [Candida parapsilosis]KAF6064317.1 Alcohol acetyltransferase family protein [Candida parapsilosis]KAI5904685.1 hypothetical protein K4G60_g3843 [Candida parapsilosis]